MSKRALLPPAIVAIAWAVILQAPFGSTLLPALVTLGVVHLFAPVWTVWVVPGDVLHRKFLTGPLLLFAIDIGCLYVAFKLDVWRDLTTVFVPVLAAVAFVALLYAAGTMSLLAKLRARRRRRRTD